MLSGTSSIRWVLKMRTFLNQPTAAAPGLMLHPSQKALTKHPSSKRNQATCWLSSAPGKMTTHTCRIPQTAVKPGRHPNLSAKDIQPPQPPCRPRIFASPMAIASKTHTVCAATCSHQKVTRLPTPNSSSETTAPSQTSVRQGVSVCRIRNAVRMVMCTRP